MSRHDYEKGLEIAARDEPFYALIQAAMRKADMNNTTKLRRLFPETYAELSARYNSPGGLLEWERESS